MTKKQINRRKEILFLYDVVDNNPNGDPAADNRPRRDEETEINLVTDVRMKRTVRDYIIQTEKQSPHNSVWIAEEEDKKGNLKTRETKIKEFKENHKLDNTNKKKLKAELLKEYVDLRLFGATIGLTAKEGKGESIAVTGPVQFNFGRSLHPVEIMTVKGTATLPSKEGLKQGTFVTTYIIPYSLIAFYGVVNENAAITTGLTEEDVSLLYQGLWFGTKNLITRSKMGHAPRLLIIVDYNEKNYQLGDLRDLISLVPNEGKKPKELRSILDYTIDITQLIKSLESIKDRIHKVYLLRSHELVLTAGNKPIDLEKELKSMSLPVSELKIGEA
ncbi:MAG: type I-B CRISPR-associated protein Cas7/Csh2 [Candidatus Heimdallarchaeota archaeon]|nr:type I-B CRISPR-associated protein Cas7/Csh2 [Candidatus Heimdallarchaeota archaeon]